MTEKTQSRRDRDAKARAAHGGNVTTISRNREKTTRAWYELKVVHQRTTSYIHQLAEKMQQYNNPLVLSKIAKNGDADAFKVLQARFQQHAATLAVDLQELWNRHKDRKKLCLSIKEVHEAYEVFGQYQQFDADFFGTFQPLLSDMNDIFNKALKQLLDAQNALQTETIETAQAKMLDVNVISDVEVTELTKSETKSWMDTDQEVADANNVGRGQTTAQTFVAESPRSDADLAASTDEAGNIKHGHLNLNPSAEELAAAGYVGGEIPAEWPVDKPGVVKTDFDRVHGSGVPIDQAASEAVGETVSAGRGQTTSMLHVDDSPVDVRDLFKVTDANIDGLTPGEPGNFPNAAPLEPSDGTMVEGSTELEGEDVIYVDPAIRMGLVRPNL